MYEHWLLYIPTKKRSRQRCRISYGFVRNLLIGNLYTQRYIKCVHVCRTIGLQFGGRICDEHLLAHLFDHRLFDSNPGLAHDASAVLLVHTSARSAMTRTASYSLHDNFSISRLRSAFSCFSVIANANDNEGGTFRNKLWNSSDRTTPSTYFPGSFLAEERSYR